MRPNRPHISSSIQFSKSYRPTKFPTGANHLRFVESRIFRFSEQSQPLALRFRPSPSRFRFGEAVSTEQGRNPQEQKTQFDELSAKFPIYPQFPSLGEISDQMVKRLAQLCYANIPTQAARSTGLRDLSQRIASNPATAAT